MVIFMFVKTEIKEALLMLDIFELVAYMLDTLAEINRIKRKILLFYIGQHTEYKH